MTLKVCESTVESAALEWFGANKGDVLDCFGKMPSLRRAGLPGSFSLPKQLRMFPSPNLSLHTPAAADVASRFRPVGEVEREARLDQPARHDSAALQDQLA